MSEEQLFDLHSDPEERQDLARDADKNEMLVEMRERMRRSMNRLSVSPEWWDAD